MKPILRQGKGYPSNLPGYEFPYIPYTCFYILRKSNPLLRLSYFVSIAYQAAFHHITLSGTVQLPWGFQISPIVQYGSARPYDLRSGFDVLDQGSGYSRPVIVPNSDANNYTFFNPINGSTQALTNSQVAVYNCLVAKTCHQVGYGTLRGDAFFQMDMRVAKNFRLREGWNLQLIFQAFNLTNKTNYGNDFHNTNTSGVFLKPEGYINPGGAGVIPRSFEGEFGDRFTF
jgi:hypothetical protein